MAPISTDIRNLKAIIMKQTFEEQEKKRLIKKFHVLLSKAGIDNDTKAAMLMNYGVETSKDLGCEELIELCGRLQKMTGRDESDVWRRRVIASIDGYLKLSGQERNIDVIKAIAVRASGFDSFNSIPVSRLRNLYYAFRDKQEDIKNVNMVISMNMPTMKNIN